MQVDYVKSLSKSIVINIASYTSSIHLLLSWPCPGSYNSARWPGLLKIIFALAFNERYSVIMPFFFGKLNYWKHGIPLQYSCLENPMDRGAWQASVHGVAKNQTRLSDFTFRHWRRKWQPTLVLLPGKSHGWRSLVSYSPWGHKESDTIEWHHFHSAFNKLTI